MNYWLLKTEPSVFSFDDLLQAPNRTTCWEGVRNYQARNLLRDSLKKDDCCLIYYSNIDEPQIAGIAEVAREGYLDTTALDKTSRYFDEKAAAKGASPWYMVDVRATHRFESPITRTQLKSEKALSKMVVLQKGSRLSVQPVTEAEFKCILTLGTPKRL